MNTSTNKNVVYIKDIPSNLIEEAIFILKSDIDETDNKKANIIRNEIILKETEDIVKQYEDELDLIEIEDDNVNSNIMNNFKLKMVLIGVLVACVGYLISLII